MKNFTIPLYFRPYFFLLAWLMSSSVMAQQQTIKGQVLDQQGESLPGVTVLEKGTTNGTITDIDGIYTLKVGENATLEFSYVGFRKESVMVNGQTQINMTLSEDIVQMAEVVVVGYGTVEKKDLTGSVSTVSAEDFELQPVVRLESALQAKVPGVVVNQNSGNPGSGLKVRIRGINSFSGGNNPLYVIDGFVGADVQSINPNDIQSISVLKDASAAALYGSQGSNGVIIITTKQGTKKTKVDVSYQKGISQLRQRWDLMENWQYMQTINDKLRAGGTPEENLTFSRRDILEAQSAGGTDWQDEVFQTGIQDQVQLTAASGNFFLSGSGQWNKGIVTGTEYNRYNMRLNYKDELFKGVDLFLSISDAFEDRKNADEGEHISIIRTATGWPSNLPIIDPATGDYTRNAAYGPLQTNPVFQLEQSPSRNLRNNFLTNGYLKFKIMEGLTFKTQGAVELTAVSNTSFSRVSPNNVANQPLNSSYGNSNNMTFNWQTNQQLDFNKKIGVHSFKTTAVYEARAALSRNFGASGQELSTTDLGYFSAPVSNNSLQRNSSGRSNTELWSLLGRINYSLKDKYLMTLNVRRDNSSRLAEGYEGATFYGGALAYRISEEPFIQGIRAVEELKLRLSAGQNGSQSVGFATTIETVGYNNGYSFDGATISRGANLQTPRNKALTWETTNQINGGFDLSLFKGRINSTFDVFYKRTNDLIFSQQLPEYAGGGSILVNAGSMENKGIELMVSGYLIDEEDLSWEISANGSVIRNNLRDILGESDFIASGKNQRDNPDLLDNTHRNFVGQPVGLLWGLVYDGVYSTDQEAEAAQFNRSPGDPIYRDLDNNGQIDNADMKVIGNPNPDFTWGLNSNVRYKNFTLNMVWNGVHGVDVLNSLKYSTYGGHRNATNVDVLNRWTPENQDSNIPGYTKTSVLYRQSSQWIEDGSFIKLRNITLKYDIPVSTISWINGISEISVFVTAQNVLVISDYSGYDPESLSDNGDRGGGFDEGGYPIPRTFLTGVKIKF